jgi:hypothetical protein
MKRLPVVPQGSLKDAKAELSGGGSGRFTQL